MDLARWRALPLARRRQIFAVVLLAVGAAFPFLTGNAGNVDAAANAFMDAFAQRRTLRGAFTVSINWDGWQAAGMGVDSRRRQQCRR